MESTGTRISHHYVKKIQTSDKFHSKSLQVVDEEQQAVGDVDLAHAGVEVDAEQVHVGIDLLDATLHAARDDVVGNAAERLQRDDVVHAHLGKFGHLGSE